MGYQAVASTSLGMRSKTRTFCSLNVLGTDCTILLVILYFESCILNVHKIGNVLCISIKISISC